MRDFSVVRLFTAAAASHICVLKRVFFPFFLIFVVFFFSTASPPPKSIFSQEGTIKQGSRELMPSLPHHRLMAGQQCRSFLEIFDTTYFIEIRTTSPTSFTFKRAIVCHTELIRVEKVHGQAEDKRKYILAAIVVSSFAPF